ncbi:hypothetical protein PENCOP_c002G01211 [Penicillium coprophilum]|uniref:Uncharacterized protein n=1 Tax=Penicillium coprophilum TaxID=36646 RepID=A0A1V6V366_9EURO|nr:hypothetical protein PENCOP_c002G01211 [Penicillium coprophilum]
MSYAIYGDKTEEEIDLEISGDIHLLQRYRYATVANVENRATFPTGLKGSLQTEVALRENTQRELALKEKIEKFSKGSNVAVLQGLQEESWTLSKEYWILERRCQNGTCIKYFGKIVLGEEAVVAETVDAALIAGQNGNLQLVIAPWGVIAARKPGALHSTLRQNSTYRITSSLIAVVHVRGITVG